jgi:hypothetical protein
LRHALNIDSIKSSSINLIGICSATYESCDSEYYYNEDEYDSEDESDDESSESEISI